MLVLNSLVFAFKPGSLAEYLLLELFINILLINASVHSFAVFSLRIIVLVKHKSI
jgi:hypothetical protein